MTAPKIIDPQWDASTVSWSRKIISTPSRVSPEAVAHFVNRLALVGLHEAAKEFFDMSIEQKAQAVAGRTDLNGKLLIGEHIIDVTALACTPLMLQNPRMFSSRARKMLDGIDHSKSGRAAGNIGFRGERLYHHPEPGRAKAFEFAVPYAIEHDRVLFVMCGLDGSFGTRHLANELFASALDKGTISPIKCAPPVETKPVETKPVETKPVETKPSRFAPRTVRIAGGLAPSTARFSGIMNRIKP